MIRQWVNHDSPTIDFWFAGDADESWFATNQNQTESKLIKSNWITNQNESIRSEPCSIEQYHLGFFRQNRIHPRMHPLFYKLKLLINSKLKTINFWEKCHKMRLCNVWPARIFSIDSRFSPWVKIVILCLFRSFWSDFY